MHDAAGRVAPASAAPMDRWSVYMVRCRDGALYTGVATDVRRRIGEHTHAGGKGAKALRGRGPLRLVLQRAVGSRGLALRIEGAIKRLPKARKEDLIAQKNLIERLIERARARLSASSSAPKSLVDRDEVSL